MPYTKATDRVLARVAEDEPLFVLRGQDALAVPTMTAWIREAMLQKVAPAKIQGALLHRDAIAAWQQEHPERVKIPD